MRRRALFLSAPLLLVASSAVAGDFTYDPPGHLVADSGQGRADDTVFAPGIRFPIEEAPAFANSQVYGAGGSLGPAGGQCDAVNFSYPWHDNYCETRQWEMPLCPAGTGHQGQDVRAASCEKDVHWAVAVADGTVTSIGGYTVYVTAADGTRFDYLHMGSVQVTVGDEVTRGQRLGRVSNVFNDTPTTVHLHFNIQQYVEGVGTVFVPPYTSLVGAYQKLVGPPPGTAKGTFESAGCGGLRGFAQDPASPASASPVLLAFDGPAGSLDASEVTLSAGVQRGDLCDILGSCDHGFESRLPLSLADGREHQVHAYALDAGGGEAELAGSPLSFTCPPAELTGVRRRLPGIETLLAWKLSAFWDISAADEGAVAALPEGPDLGGSPSLVADEEGALWLLDGEFRRSVSDEAFSAFRFDDPKEKLSAAELDAILEGPPLRPAPVLVQASAAEVYLVDDPMPEASPPAGVGGGGDAGASLDGDASCACGVAGGSTRGGPWLAVGLAALWLARRRGSTRR